MGVNPKTLSDRQLMSEVKKRATASCHAEADLLAFLAEVDARRLYLEEACSSMFVYCVQVLNFSEDAACNRIAVARASREHPTLLAALRCGDVHLSGLRLIVSGQPGKHDVAELLEAAKHKSKREIEKLMADRKPRADAPEKLQRVPMLRSAPPGSPPISAVSPSTRLPEPLGRGRFKVQFMLGEDGETRLREVRALLRHQIPNGDLGEIFARALKLLHAEARRRRFAATPTPRPPRQPKAKPNRHIPASIRREVEVRDEGRCTFVSRDGRRCGTQDFLQFHHLDNWAWVKRHCADRIVLRCWGHNQHAARQDFGEEWMAHFSTRPGTGGS
jgi:hypothetical protein